MRTEVERIRQQLNQAFHGDSWHGEYAFSVLDAISPAEAAWRPEKGGHTIQEIVLHTAAWLDAVVDRIDTRVVRKLTDAEDWPEPGPGAEGWEADLGRLRESCARVDRLLADLHDADLDRRIMGQRKEWSAYEDLHGVVQHSLYHLGQIVILARWARQAS